MHLTREDARLAGVGIGRRRLLIPGAAVIVCAVLLGLLFWLRSGPLGIDSAWLGELREEERGYLLIVSLVMNALGGGVVAVLVIPLGGAALFLIARRPYAAAVWVISLAASAGVVQVIKNLVGRARPDDIWITADFGSFPSGHTANAATVAVVLSLLFPRFWTWALGAAATLLMALTRTYLGAHWLSDTLGGVLVGVGVALIVWAPFSARLLGEERRLVERRRALVSANIEVPIRRAKEHA